MTKIDNVPSTTTSPSVRDGVAEVKVLTKRKRQAAEQSQKQKHAGGREEQAKLFAAANSALRQTSERNRSFASVATLKGPGATGEGAQSKVIRPTGPVPARSFMSGSGRDQVELAPYVLHPNGDAEARVLKRNGKDVDGLIATKPAGQKHWTVVVDLHAAAGHRSSGPGGSSQHGRTSQHTSEDLHRLLIGFGNDLRVAYSIYQQTQAAGDSRGIRAAESDLQTAARYFSEAFENVNGRPPVPDEINLACGDERPSRSAHGNLSITDRPHRTDRGPSPTQVPDWVMNPEHDLTVDVAPDWPADPDTEMPYWVMNPEHDLPDLRITDAPLDWPVDPDTEMPPPQPSKRARGRTLSEEEKSRIRNLYVSGEQPSISALANQFKVSESSIGKALRVDEKTTLARPSGRRSKLSEEQKSRIRDLYDNGAGLSIKALAKEFRADRTTIRNVLGIDEKTTLSRSGGRPKKLSEEQISQIRRLRESDPKPSISALAKRFNVSAATIFNVLNNTNDTTPA
ncbi:helix-turn-helix domain-containing protein, partial [uncultured Tateyamaria sp.]|uniref:helix-turn-helix domain-containing protein n=1 Tax=uncultured Tateyamaria sp. TaxID=455651 RepID=UPI002636898E